MKSNLIKSKVFIYGFLLLRFEEEEERNAEVSVSNQEGLLFYAFTTLTVYLHSAKLGEDEIAKTFFNKFCLYKLS